MHKLRSIWIFWSGIALVSLGLAACGLNLYDGLVEGEGDRYHMEEARIALNAEDFTEAQKHLALVKHETNAKVMMDVTAVLGQAGVNFWTMLLDVFEETKNSSGGSGSGMEQVFAILSDSVFGEGPTRQSRLTALASAVNVLAGAPDAEDAKVDSFRCFLSGILVMPTANDGQVAMAKASAALDHLAASLDSSSGACADLGDFQTAMDEVARVQNSLALVMQQTAGCSMLNFSQTTGSLNEVEKRLQKFTAAADLGCDALACDSAVCRALATGCVQQVVGDTAVAGDGKVNRCELLYNCRTPGSCF